jgi:protein-disulfide isomerase/uncharacterized membrane protein
MKVTQRLAIVLVLAAVGAVLAGSLLLQHHGEHSGVVESICGSGDTGCDQVNQSAWSKVAGVPWSAIGLVFYLAVMAAVVIAFAAGDDVRASAGAAMFAAFALGLVIDAVLFGIQAFRIHAYCKLCLATYAVNVAAVALLWPLKRARSGLGGIFAAPAARIAAAGWLTTAAALVVGVGFAEATLREREAQRAANVLGAPPAPASEPEPTAAATPELPTSGATTPDLKKYQEQLKSAQDEVKRLKETLDDPAKYDAYQTQKGLSDFAKASPSHVNLEGVPFKGPADAPIQIVDFADYLCPHCRNVAHGLGNWLGTTQGRVKIFYKNYPLDSACNPGSQVHPGACWLAYGGICAHEQGRFWPYHDRVFSLEPQKTPPDRAFVVRLAAELGMNQSAFDSCIASNATREKVVAEVQEGTKAGVKGTPTLFINKKRLPNLNVFFLAVEEESKRLGLGPMPQPPQTPH